MRVKKPDRWILKKIFSACILISESIHFAASLFEATKKDSIAVVIQLVAYYGLWYNEVLGIC